MPLRNLQILLLVTCVCVACWVQAERLKYAGKIGSAIWRIEQDYVEEIDGQELYLAAMEGLVSKLDQNSNFIPPRKYEEFQEVIEQRFGGIGIMVEGPPAVKRLTVIAPIPGTPAFKAGLQPGDVILEIDGVSTADLPVDKATEKMRGPLNESVELKLQAMGNGLTRKVTVSRAEIQTNSVHGDRVRGDSTWEYFLEEDPRIAYIRISLFGERTTSEFRTALSQVKAGAKALVIDLRHNPGGILQSATEICDMLLDRGTIVTTRGRREIFRSERSAEADLELPMHVPIVVLVDDQSASASEIMAGCLQDLNRALVAGQRSFGKGTVQQIFDLEDQTALKITTARFYRPSGKNIHRTEKMTEQDEWGITPDAELALPLGDLEKRYLQKRWNMREDPRIMASEERPPAPAFAGDPQLECVVQFLKKTLKEL